MDLGKENMNVAIVGTGFVGVVTASVLAQHGHTIWGVDIDEKKVEGLNEGKVPFFEPELDNLIRSALDSGRLHFTTDYKEAISQADVAMIAVGTPSSSEGKADLSYVFAASKSLAPFLKEGAVVVVKSTVPPGSFAQVAEVLNEHATTSYHLASVPEFLREGSAVKDTQHPDRIVLGVSDDHSRTVLENLHKQFEAPIIVTSPESAQLSKYAANAYLALRIGFINQIADFCEVTGANIQDVISIIGKDKRIGDHYWYPGLGYGGSCFPKDVRELAYTSKSLELGDTLFTLLNALNGERIEKKFREWSEEVGSWSGKKVAVLGLSFKPNTTDLREAPSLIIIPKLAYAGATVVGYDPMAVNEAHHVFDKLQGVSLTNDISEAIAEADVIIALIEWPEIIEHSFPVVAGVHFIDVRNQFNPETMRELGYLYDGTGIVGDLA